MRHSKWSVLFKLSYREIKIIDEPAALKVAGFLVLSPKLMIKVFWNSIIVRTDKKGAKPARSFEPKKATNSSNWPLASPSSFLVFFDSKSLRILCTFFIGTDYTS